MKRRREGVGEETDEGRGWGDKEKEERGKYENLKEDIFCLVLQLSQ